MMSDDTFTTIGDAAQTNPIAVLGALSINTDAMDDIFACDPNSPEFNSSAICEQDKYLMEVRPVIRTGFKTDIVQLGPMAIKVGRFQPPTMV